MARLSRTVGLCGSYLSAFLYSAIACWYSPFCTKSAARLLRAWTESGANRSTLWYSAIAFSVSPRASAETASLYKFAAFSCCAAADERKTISTQKAKKSITQQLRGYLARKIIKRFASIRSGGSLEFLLMHFTAAKIVDRCG